MKTGVINISGKLVIDMRARHWCTLPYPGHPKGCPNYNQSSKCPPKIDVIRDIFDITKQFWLVVVKFDLKDIDNYQNPVRKVIVEKCELLLKNNAGLRYTLVPEALGINVFETVRNIGIPIKKEVKDTLYKIALIGFKCNLTA